jgi:hypothetical protein
MDNYKDFFIFFYKGYVFPKKIQFILIVVYTFIFLKIPLPVVICWFSNFKTWQICIKDMHIKILIILLNKKNLQ